MNKGGKQNAMQSVGQRQSDKHEATDEPGMNIMCILMANRTVKKIVGLHLQCSPQRMLEVQHQNNVF